MLLLIKDELEFQAKLYVTDYFYSKWASDFSASDIVPMRRYLAMEMVNA